MLDDPAQQRHHQRDQLVAEGRQRVLHVRWDHRPGVAVDQPGTDLPVEDYAAALESAGLPASAAKVVASSDAGVARGELQDDGHQLSQLIGRPTTPLTEAIRAAVA